MVSCCRGFIPVCSLWLMIPNVWNFKNQSLGGEIQKTTPNGEAPCFVTMFFHPWQASRHPFLPFHFVWFLRLPGGHCMPLRSTDGTAIGVWLMPLRPAGGRSKWRGQTWILVGHDRIWGWPLMKIGIGFSATKWCQKMTFTAARWIVQKHVKDHAAWHYRPW